MVPGSYKMTFFKKRPIYFHINSTKVMKAIQQNKLIFSNIEINKPLPALA